MRAHSSNAWIRHPQLRNLAVVIAVPLVAVGAYLSITSLAPERGYVEQVVDGQTVDVRLRDETVRVRLADLVPIEGAVDGSVEGAVDGADAAADRRAASEAKDLLAETLRVGKAVTLEWDGDHADGYPLARLITEDGELVNASVPSGTDTAAADGSATPPD